MVKELSDGVTITQILQKLRKNSHWRKLSMIMVWERYCYASPKLEFFVIFFVYIFIHISANMSPFGLIFSQIILHTETSKLMYKLSFLFVVLHKPTLLPSTFKILTVNGLEVTLVCNITIMWCWGFVTMFPVLKAQTIVFISVSRCICRKSNLGSKGLARMGCKEHEGRWCGVS